MFVDLCISQPLRTNWRDSIILLIWICVALGSFTYTSQTALPQASSHILSWWLGCTIISSAYFGSMKPFSEGEPGSLGYRIHIYIYSIYGIFAYMFTIKIIHSRRVNIPYIHGSYILQDTFLEKQRLVWYNVSGRYVGPGDVWPCPWRSQSFRITSFSVPSASMTHSSHLSQVKTTRKTFFQSRIPRPESSGVKTRKTTRTGWGWGRSGKRCGSIMCI